MKKIILLLSLFGCLLFSQKAISFAYDFNCCDDCQPFYEYSSPFFPFDFYVSHLEGSGIGYDQGYTSYGIFYMPFLRFQRNFQTFFEYRGHFFNNGKQAGNFGVGTRYIDPCTQKVYGVNLYYDYRHIHHKHFQQIGCGFEYLGRRWDFRINGYIPIGRHNEIFNRVRYREDDDDDSFCERFQVENAMSGFNAEIGFPLWKRRNPCNFLNLYAAVGPYYFTCKTTDFWGGMLRLTAKFWDYVEIEGRTTYDEEFHWRGEGLISLIFPFEKMCFGPYICCNKYSENFQPVCRQEIIVVSRPRHFWEEED